MWTLTAFGVTGARLVRAAPAGSPTTPALPTAANHAQAETSLPMTTSYSPSATREAEVTPVPLTSVPSLATTAQIGVPGGP